MNVNILLFAFPGFLHMHMSETKMDELIEDIEDLNKNLITVIKTLDELKEGIIYCYIF